VKILLLGKSGQVGWELQRSLSPLGELIALDRYSTDFCGDLTKLNELHASILAIQPDVIVNAAAYTAVDKAETEWEQARLINALAPEMLAAVAKKLNALLIHYSTDYVFDGSGNNARTETDDVAPLSVYGKTKLNGEQAIIASGCDYYIFRTSWVYAARGNNFAKTMLRLAREKKELNVIADQIGAPTGADLIADVTALAISKGSATKSGVYNLVAGGETSWYEYAKLVVEFARARGECFTVGKDNVLATDSSSFKTAARRPLNSRLNTQKLQQTFSLQLPHWKKGVERMLIEILEKS
jgi:dTDP-4-dehydrorhamnose reductase